MKIHRLGCKGHGMFGCDAPVSHPESSRQECESRMKGLSERRTDGAVHNVGLFEEEWDVAFGIVCVVEGHDHHGADLAGVFRSLEAAKDAASQNNDMVTAIYAHHSHGCRLGFVELTVRDERWVRGAQVGGWTETYQFAEVQQTETNREEVDDDIAINAALEQMFEPGSKLPA